MDIEVIAAITTSILAILAAVKAILETLKGIKKDRVIAVLIDGIEDIDHSETKHAVFNRSTKASTKVKEVLETSVRNREAARRLKKDG